MTLYVRVSRIAIKSVFPPDKTYAIAVGSLPRGKARTAIATIDNFDLKTRYVWSLCLDDTEDDRIWIGLFQQRALIGETKLGSLVIPMEWLPRNRVVKVSFPLRLVGQDWDRALPTLVKMHYATRGTPRFKAPQGELTVRPAWGLKQPKVKKGAEVEPEVEVEPEQARRRMVMIPREVYEHMRALQQQVEELQQQLAERRAAEQGVVQREGEGREEANERDLMVEEREGVVQREGEGREDVNETELMVEEREAAVPIADQERHPVDEGQGEVCGDEGEVCGYEGEAEDGKGPEDGPGNVAVQEGIPAEEEIAPPAVLAEPVAPEEATQGERGDVVNVATEPEETRRATIGADAEQEAPAKKKRVGKRPRKVKKASPPESPPAPTPPGKNSKK
jgi:hypothetical protein